MVWQTFASLAAGNQPLSLFDTLAQQIAQCVVIPCTASGTNNISLVANANGPPVTAYNNYALFSFVAVNTSTGNCQLQVASIGLLNLYNPGGTAQAGSGAIVAGAYYVVAYQSQLNTGAGGFVIVSATPSSLTLPVTVPNGGTGDTSLTAYAVLCGGTTSTNPVQPIASVGTLGQVLTSNGPGALPTMQTASSGGGSLVSIVTYTSTQTITIPGGATNAWVRMQGSSGGAKGNVSNGSAASGAGAYLEKWLTGLTAANTLALTIGAGGTTAPGNGGATTLASGTQSITTLTAGGSVAATAGVGSASGGAGGAATNGDLNVRGASGWGTGGGGCPPSSTNAIPGASTIGGATYGWGVSDQSDGTGVAGNQGLCIIFWFS
jgi:hypothetical protein